MCMFCRKNGLGIYILLINLSSSKKHFQRKEVWSRYPNKSDFINPLFSFFSLQRFGVLFIFKHMIYVTLFACCTSGRTGGLGLKLSFSWLLIDKTSNRGAIMQRNPLGLRVVLVCVSLCITWSQKIQQVSLRVMGLHVYWGMIAANKKRDIPLSKLKG